MNADNESILLKAERNEPELTAICIDSQIEGGYFPHGFDGWNDLGRAIGKNTYIKSLEIRFDGIELGLGCLAAFCKGLSQNRSIEKLALNECDFFDMGWARGGVFNFIERNQNLRHINLEGSCLGSMGIQLLSYAIERRAEKSVEELCLGVPLMDDGEARRGGDKSTTAALINSLRGYHQLRDLDLKGNHVGRDGCTIMTSLLQSQHCNLQTLCLGDSGIDDGAMDQLTTALIHQNCVLNSLGLERNPLITARGWRGISSALRHKNCILGVIYLDCNSIDDDAVIHLAKSVAISEDLMFLGLSYNRSVTNGGWTTYATLLGSPTCTLVSLDLSENNIGDDVAIALATSLMNNFSLKSLDLSNNPSITNDGWDAFSRLLCDKSSINNTYLSNHTLEVLNFDESVSLLHPEPAMRSLIRPDLTVFLELNKIDEECSGRQKILTNHFFGDFSMEPFEEMKVQLLVHVFAWIGRDDESKGVKHNGTVIASALFHFLRSEPSLVAFTNKTSAGKTAGISFIMDSGGIYNTNKKRRCC